MTASRMLGMRKTTLTSMTCRVASRDVLAGGVLGLVVTPLLITRVGVVAFRHRRRSQLVPAVDPRSVVAREVHDGLAQELAFVASNLQRLDGAGVDGTILTQIQAAVQRALLEARVTIEVLRAPEDAPLDLLVERAVTVFEARFGVAVKLDLAQKLNVDTQRRTALLRILGQAMANAVAHGGAANMTVRLRPCEKGVSLRVADDGCGFDPSHTAPGWGLIGMRERAELLGGQLMLASRPGEGAALEVMLP